MSAARPRCVSLVRWGTRWSLAHNEWSPEFPWSADFEAWLQAEGLNSRHLHTAEVPTVLVHLEPHYAHGSVEIGVERQPTVVELPYETAVTLFRSLAAEQDGL